MYNLLHLLAKRNKRIKNNFTLLVYIFVTCYKKKHSQACKATNNCDMGLINFAISLTEYVGY